MYQAKSRVVVTPNNSFPPVTITLQLVSGESLTVECQPNGNSCQHVFLKVILTFTFSTATLWDILLHWESENKLKPALSSLTVADIPVCIYLLKEISSKDSLQAMTLLQLGISNGKAAIR